MKITRVSIQNYRSVENLELEFPSYYAAICGKNDAGKTNVLRMIRVLLRESDPYGAPDYDVPSVKSDYPKWKTDELKERRIRFSVEIEIYPESDEGLYNFLVDYLKLDGGNTPLNLKINAEYSNEKEEGEHSIIVNSTPFGELQSQEVLNKIQSSNSILFHNSTEVERGYRFPSPKLS